MCDDFEDAMNKIIKDIEKNPEKYKFEPGAYYNDTGDILHIHWKESSYYAEWINHRITLLRDQETKEVVGCQVWGLKAKVLKEEEDMSKEEKKMDIYMTSEGMNLMIENFEKFKKELFLNSEYDVDLDRYKVTITKECAMAFDWIKDMIETFTKELVEKGIATYPDYSEKE